MTPMWMIAPLAAMSLISAGAEARLSPAQHKEIQARQQLANAIVSRYEHEAKAKRFGPEWRLGMMHTLLAVPSSTLQSLAASAGSVSQRELVRKAKTAKGRPGGKALGDVDEDLVFTPLTPCRLADTRFAGGPIPQGSVRGFSDEDSATQGGAASCSQQIVAYPEARAYALNLTLVNMTTNGFVAIRPVGDTNITSIANFTGPGQQVNNFVIVENTQNSTNEFEVYASATTDVIIDVYGLFLPPEATALDCVTTATSNFNIGANVTEAGGSSPSCSSGYTVVSGSCSESGDARLVDYEITGNAWTCRWDAGPVGGTASVAARCCRVPGR